MFRDTRCSDQQDREDPCQQGIYFLVEKIDNKRMNNHTRWIQVVISARHRNNVGVRWETEQWVWVRWSILDGLTREGLPEEVAIEQSPEVNAGVRVCRMGSGWQPVSRPWEWGWMGTACSGFRPRRSEQSEQVGSQRRRDLRGGRGLPQAPTGLGGHEQNFDFIPSVMGNQWRSLNTGVVYCYLC